LPGRRIGIEELPRLSEDSVRIAEINRCVGFLWRFAFMNIVIVVDPISSVQVKFNVRLSTEKTFDVLIIEILGEQELGT
jgi:hypothetical protein